MPWDPLGYNEQIHYVEGQGRKQSKNRSRNIVWFNPSYSQNIRTNFAESFLCLIDKHFLKSHKLHKIFNRNNLTWHCTFKTNLGLKGRKHRLRDQLAHHQKAEKGKRIQRQTISLQPMFSWKTLYLDAQNASLLNKKSELVTKCRHENNFFVATNKKKRPSNRSRILNILYN